MGEQEFLIAMAGTHQLWVYNRARGICYRYSGSGGEGNLNAGPENS